MSMQKKEKIKIDLELLCLIIMVMLTIVFITLAIFPITNYTSACEERCVHDYEFWLNHTECQKGEWDKLKDC